MTRIMTPRKKGVTPRGKDRTRCHVCDCGFGQDGRYDGGWMIRYDGRKRMPLCVDCYRSCAEGMKVYLERNPKFEYAKWRGGLSGSD